MTQEIKDKLEQAAKEYFGYDPKGDGEMQKVVDVWFDSAQNILDNPHEWGLTENKNLHGILKSTVLELENKDSRINLMSARIKGLQSQLTKYREVLERFATMTQNDVSGHYVSGTEKYPVEEAARVIKNFMDLVNHIAKEALKQEDATCPKCGYPLFKHLSKTCCQGCDYVKQQ